MFDNSTSDGMEVLRFCRCCLLRPPIKDLKTPYEHRDKTEIYSDMIKDCFDVDIHRGNEECGICELCVGRLRDAQDFKLQVQRSQVELQARETALHVSVSDEKNSVKSEMWDDSGGEMVEENISITPCDETVVKPEMSDNDSAEIDEDLTTYEESPAKSEISNDASSGEECTTPWWSGGTVRAREQLAMTCVVWLERLRDDSHRTCVREPSEVTRMKRAHADGAEEQPSEATRMKRAHADGLEEQLSEATRMKRAHADGVDEQASEATRMKRAHADGAEEQPSEATRMKRAHADGVEEPTYTCDACQRHFYTKLILIMHVRKHMPPDELTLISDIEEHDDVKDESYYNASENSISTISEDTRDDDEAMRDCSLSDIKHVPYSEQKVTSYKNSKEQFDEKLKEQNKTQYRRDDAEVEDGTPKVQSEAEQNLTQDKVTGSTESQGGSVKGKRVRQRDFCLYCESYILNFSRHMVRNHQAEPEVQEALAAPKNSAKRKKVFRDLQKKGNYKSNVQSSFKPMKQSRLSDKADYLPCKKCLGFYSKKQLWKHRKKCDYNLPTNHAQVDAQNFLLPNVQVDKNLMLEVFPRMRPDKISLIAKKDSLICMFGANYLRTHRGKHFAAVVSRKMRELAKLFVEVSKLEPHIVSLEQALKPQHYDTLVQATKIVAQYDETERQFNAPTYAMNIATSIKQCCRVALLHSYKTEATVDTARVQSEFKSLTYLIEYQWKFDISSQAANDLSAKKIKKSTIVPLASDLKGKSLDQIKLTMNEENEDIVDFESTDEDEDPISRPKGNISNNPLHHPSISEEVPNENHKIKRTLTPWTTEQKSVVTKYFKDHIESKRPPRRAECDALKDKYSTLLQNKDWLKIKVYVQNSYTKK